MSLMRYEINSIKRGITMFTIIKSKGKTYKTECPEHALHAYMNKRALSIWFDGNVVLTKTSKNMAYTQAQVWNYLEAYNVKEVQNV